MMPLILGVLLLGAVVMLLRWYGQADTKKLKSSARWTGILLLLIIILFFAATGRLGAAFAFLMGLFAWAWRVFNMIQMGNQMASMFRSARSGFGSGMASGATSGQTSQVQSAFLRMTLNHDTGGMDGEVLKGTFMGKRLVQMSRTDLSALLGEMSADADSLQLLEAFMDRAHPDWREGATGTEQGGARPPARHENVMGLDEARRILGVAENATDDQIKAAYRRLMAQLHPDKGGSDYLAAKVNQAKDMLLKKAS